MNYSIEKEIKILGIDKEEIQNKLNLLGAKQILNCRTHMFWFDIKPHEDLSKTNCKEVDEMTTEVKDLLKNYKNDTLKCIGGYLRIRTEGDRCDFTLKYSLPKGSERKPHATNKEISISLEPKKSEEIKEAMLEAGFYIIATHEKDRISYQLQATRCDIDTWPLIPTYMEIETDEISTIKKLIKDLGLESNKTTNLLGQELFKQFGCNFFEDMIFD